MATSQIAWGDGSGDYIYVSYPSASGDQTLSVSSDANTGTTTRSKTITIATTAGSPTQSVQVSVSQPGQSLPNYAYDGIYYSGVSGGSCVFGYGTKTYMISPIFTLTGVSSLTFSVGTTNAGCIVFLDSSTGLYNSYYASNSNPRTVSPSSTIQTKLGVLCFKTENLANSYVYDNTNSRYLFKGSDLTSSQIHSWKAFRSESPLASGIIWENARGDFENWNLVTNASVSTSGARSVYEPPMYRVVRSASNTTAAYYNSVISKKILLPKNDPDLKSQVAWSIGKTYSGSTAPCLLMYDDDAEAANYFAANANPRTVTISNNWDYIRLIMDINYYAASYAKDVITDTYLWKGSD